MRIAFYRFFFEILPNHKNTLSDHRKIKNRVFCRAIEAFILFIFFCFELFSLPPSHLTLESQYRNNRIGPIRITP